MSKRIVTTAAVGLLFFGAGCVSGSAKPMDPSALDAAPTSVPASARLDLSGKGLSRVPAYAFDMRDLVELDVSDNDLTGALQGEIRHLQKLQVLDASGNRMTGVPAEIGQLKELRELDLSDNMLTGLPLELGNLPALGRLDLRGNDISTIDLEAIRAKLKGTEILE